MQAITTKFICPTNFKGSRISAQADAGRIILSCDDALNMEENHILKEEAHTILAHMEEEFMQPDIQYLESDPADGAEGSSEWDSGWYFRLSAPGYLDCTGWSGPFDTEEEAVEACIDMYFYDWGSL
jgi:hypothetical protein